LLRVELRGMWGFLRSSGLVIRHQEFSPAHITITVQRAKADAPIRVPGSGVNSIAWLLS
jgi:hypothetical protein